MPFYKTLENLESGPVGYATEEDIFGTRIEKLLNKGQLSPEVPAGEITAAGGGPGTIQTLTFTAPEDLTIRKMVFFPPNRATAENTTFVSEYLEVQCLCILQYTFFLK